MYSFIKSRQQTKRKATEVHDKANFLCRHWQNAYENNDEM